MVLVYCGNCIHCCKPQIGHSCILGTGIQIPKFVFFFVSINNLICYILYSLNNSTQDCICFSFNSSYTLNLNVWATSIRRYIWYCFSCICSVVVFKKLSGKPKDMGPAAFHGILRTFNLQLLLSHNLTTRNIRLLHSLQERFLFIDC